MENMTVRLKQHKGLVKTIAVIAALVLSGWLYRELHPTIIFHTPQESKYLGKIVCTARWGFGETVYRKSYCLLQVALPLELERGGRGGCFHR